MIRDMGRHKMNIMTAEDPVSTDSLIRQSQVNPAIDLTFGAFSGPSFGRTPIS